MSRLQITNKTTRGGLTGQREHIKDYTFDSRLQRPTIQKQCQVFLFHFESVLLLSLRVPQLTSDKSNVTCIEPNCGIKRSHVSLPLSDFLNNK